MSDKAKEMAQLSPCTSGTFAGTSGIFFIYTSFEPALGLDLYLQSYHDAGVLVPAQERIVPISRAGLTNVCSTSHEIFM
jgi:hypothetical protein